MSEQAVSARGGAGGSGRERKDYELRSPVASILSQLARNIEAAVAGDSVLEVAAKSGIGLRRALQIVAGAIPDGYELRRLETAYRTALWPRFDPADPRHSR